MHTQKIKPKVSTKVILEKRFTYKDGTHPVKLRVTYRGKRKYYTVRGETFTVDSFKKIIDPDSRGKNKERRKKFEAIENRADEIINDVLDEFTFESFEREFLEYKRLDANIVDYFNDKISELQKENKIQSEGLYTSTLRSLQSFNKKISFHRITPKYLTKYEKWMLDKGKSYTTIGIYLRNLRHILNRAKKNGAIKDYPFGRDKDKYSIPKSKNLKKALTLHQIELLFKYKPENEEQNRALKYWLFSYLCNGMNMADIARLQYKNIEGDILTFIRQKTKTSSNDIPYVTVFLLPEAKNIIEDLGNPNRKPNNYIFPLLRDGMTEKEKHNKVKQHIKDLNEQMRHIGKALKIDRKITTYFARHSYSTILKRSGVSVEFISEQLGHQDLKTTRNYLDSFEKEHLEKNASMLIPNKVN